MVSFRLFECFAIKSKVLNLNNVLNLWEFEVMKNDADNIYFRRDFCRSAFLLIAFLISFPVFSADGFPPPNVSYVQNSGSPVDRNLERMGYNHSTNTLRVNYSSSGGTNYSSVGGSINGNTRVNATITDSYGATARGQITTTTQVPGSTLNKAVGTLIGLQVTGAVLNSPNAKNAASAAASGNAAEAVLSSLAALDVAGIGSGINGLVDVYRDAQTQKAQEAARAAALAQQANGDAAASGQVYYAVLDFPGAGDPGENNEAGWPVIDGFWVPASYQSNRGKVPANGKPFYTYTKALPLIQLPDGSYKQVWIQKMQPGYVPPVNVTPEQVMLTSEQMVQIMIDALNRNTLTQQQLTDLLNAMHASGGLSPDNTTTTVDKGGTAATTFLTAPYTPQGSNQAQQTQFTINKDGSVTATTIPRPDLAANTSQAPTRAPVGVGQTAQDTKPVKESATASAPDICANNPNSLMCAPLGNMDYSDPVLPEKAINISLNPLNVFSTSGVCPNPLSFTLLHTNHQFSYETMCDVAAKARPWIIMLSMLFAFTLVYYALGFGQR